MQLSGGEYVVMHSHSAIVHYPSSHHGMNIEEESSHPKSVLRGFAEIEKVETGNDCFCGVWYVMSVILCCACVERTCT